MEVAVVFDVFDEWGSHIQQFLQGGTGQDIFGRGGDDIARVGKGDFVDNNNWCDLVWSNEAGDFVGGGENGAARVFEALENVDAVSWFPRENGQVGIVDEKS